MIEVQNLTKIYGKTAAIEDVSFRVEKGEILGLLGPNGAGKTTTMRILTGHTPPTSGYAFVAGFDVMKDSMAVRRCIGYLPETVGVYEDMTVRAYLSFMAEVKGVKSAGRQRRVNDMMELTGIASCAERLIRNLSKGYRQRIGFAQALIAEPEVLILDEPTVGLDPAQIREIRSLIKAMEGKKTMILSTHILPEAEALCQRIAIINLGRIAAVGTPAELAHRMSPAGRISLTARGDSSAIKAALEKPAGVLKISERKMPIPDSGHSYYIDVQKGAEIRGEIIKALIASGCELIEIATVSASLEDVYMEVVMGNRDA
ncbi:MAG TPA: ABC transporter ATP-binding protein [Candidatus Sumerlaeota bacterium]|nr:ABC transporter ATP-binding protein [Candidatus Sumerlaeota bacterium]HRS00664.1 ABC transporter ATP-binding protein [Candidatus Sumerlaeia bacterium]HON50352.1 ABC transporter ATP-binding protein [Candidatus Sumerlaeota bacterium]HOR63568.1 ABC transporter ATP-binding protein [Candidatus Sumerlaeota bacterium]HPL73534.1 ABC transporter ATP-binding protein [Candidatus Sumerlaeota bacterium]